MVIILVIPVVIFLLYFIVIIILEILPFLNDDGDDVFSLQTALMATQ